MYISDIVSIVFERGEFVKRDVELTVFSLVFLSLGFLFFAIREVFNRTFYALQDTKTPMINGAIDVLVNIVADLLLVKSLIVGGLSLATSFSYFASVICFLISWERVMHCSIGDILDSKGIGKHILSSILFFFVYGCLRQKVYIYLYV